MKMIIMWKKKSVNYGILLLYWYEKTSVQNDKSIYTMKMISILVIFAYLTLLMFIYININDAKNDSLINKELMRYLS